MFINAMFVSVNYLPGFDNEAQMWIIRKIFQAHLRGKIFDRAIFYLEACRPNARDNTEPSALCYVYSILVTEQCSVMLESQSQYQCQQWQQEFVRNQRRRSSKRRRRSQTVSGHRDLNQDEKLVISSKVTYLVSMVNQLRSLLKKCPLTIFPSM